jgi:segregation and condensation protein A
VVDIAAPPKPESVEGTFAEGGFVVELDRFQGPLDLLLHLIHEQDIDIFDIPIAQITQQFLQAMGDVDKLGLDRAGEFLEMAALLIRIKAQMLMPKRTAGDGELEDPRAELVRRLLEYEHFREAAIRFEESQLDRLRRYARGYVPPRKEPMVVTELEISWDELLNAAIGIGSRPKPPGDHHVTQRAVPVEEKITLILAALERLERVEFRRLIEPFRDNLHSVVTLLGALELAKRRDLELRQSEPFTELWLYRHKDIETDATDTDH